MRALVTGGAGFIGSALCRKLLLEGDTVPIVVDKLTYAGDLRSLQGADQNGALTFVRGDINDRNLMDEVFDRHRPEVVFHLAAESHVDRSITSSGDFIRTNIDGTYVLLEAALRYFDSLASSERASFRFLHVSTDEVFGALGPTGTFTVQTPYDPRSPYSASKAASDHLAMAWSHTYGLPVLLSNCSNNYGPYQFPEKLIPVLIVKGLAGEALPLYGDGLNVRDWLFVDDHAQALLDIARHGVVGERYLVGGRSERTNRQVAEAVCDLLDELAPDGGGVRRRLITLTQDRPGHDRRYAIDCTPIEATLGWTRRHTFESGLRTTVQWYLDNRTWWQPILADKHDGGRLGLLTDGGKKRAG